VLSRLGAQLVDMDISSFEDHSSSPRQTRVKKTQVDNASSHESNHSVYLIHSQGQRMKAVLFRANQCAKKRAKNVKRHVHWIKIVT